MDKYYVTNELPNLTKECIIVFEMPPFVSGDFRCKIFHDEKGFYTNDLDFPRWFKGCRDYELY